MSKSAFASLLAVILLVLWGCSETPQKVSSEAKRVINAYNEFGFRVFKQLTLPAAQDNVFIAPSSIAIALTIAYNGAAGETKKAMAKAMALSGIPGKDVNNANLELQRLFSKLDPKTELLTANALWLEKGLEVRKEFLTLSRKFFDAEIGSLTTPKAINDWVFRKTKGKITHLIDRIDPLVVLMITNAVYFKGLWQKQFKKRLTKPEDFYLPTGGTVKVPMMSQSNKFPYLRGDGFQAVCLPYGKTGRFGFYLFLPDKGKSLEDFLRMLNQENWERWIAGFQTMEGYLKMPRFKMEYGVVSLKKSLSTMNMAIAFDQKRANFSGICSSLWIDDVLHKAFVEVNEEGTEAAAATAILMEKAAPPLKERFTLIADRPFFFAIRDSLTGLVLFLGILNKP